MLNFCKGKIVFISTELVPKFKLVGQRYAHETSTLCSNLYFVYQGRLTGVKVPAHGAEFFNKKLRKLMKKSKDNELILTSTEVDELINRWKADNVRCANAGNLFPMRDNLLKFLQGGNRPDSIQSVILDRGDDAVQTIPGYSPMPRDGGDTEPVVSGVEKKHEFKLLDSKSVRADSAEAKKDAIARSRTSAFSYEPSQPPQISVSSTTEVDFVTHVSRGRSLYCPLPEEHKEEIESSLINVGEEADVEMNF